MFLSLSIILVFGILMGNLSNRIGVPKIVGMIISGILFGPFVLNLLDDKILNISSEIRKIALIIILIRAGLTLNLKDLKKVGVPAFLLSFLPATFEIFAYAIFAPMIFGITRIDALLMGAVLSAVSPAVVVPRMVSFIENKWGTKKGIPQMILAGASLDDIFVIILFSTFLSMSKGDSVGLKNFLNLPASIILGVLLGSLLGYLIYIFFENRYESGKYVRNSVKIVLILAISFLLIHIEDVLKNIIQISSLLAIVSMSCVLKLKSNNLVIERLVEKFGKLWIVAEIFLFVLVGAAVDIRYTFEAGISAVLMIVIALFIRSIGVLLSLIKTDLTNREKLFCVMSYLPKATVQAAIGSIPLALGISSGKTILSVAVIGILITAPLGAYLMDKFYKKILTRDVY